MNEITFHNICSSCARFRCNTLDLNVDSVMVVLDAALNLAAVHSRVIGAQLGHLDASIAGGRGVAHHLNPVQVVGVDAHSSLHRYKYCGDFLLGHAAPFDAMGERCNGRCTWVVDSEILQGGTLLVVGYHITQQIQGI